MQAVVALCHHRLGPASNNTILHRRTSTPDARCLNYQYSRPLLTQAGQGKRPDRLFVMANTGGGTVAPFVLVGCLAWALRHPTFVPLQVWTLPDPQRRDHPDASQTVICAAADCEPLASNMPCQVCMHARGQQELICKDVHTQNSRVRAYHTLDDVLSCCTGRQGQLRVCSWCVRN